MLDGATSRPKRLTVAWSGGSDSTALLAALVEIRDRELLHPLPPLRALHVDHRLNPASQRWARHCRALGRRLRVPVTVRTVKVNAAPGDSLEAAARESRQRAFEQALQPGEWLLLAHHADDQLETLMLRWLRGAGTRGLAAMRRQRPCGAGLMLRPLLDVDRVALREWLAARELTSIEDPSNAELRHDRNYLRATVLPPILARWPSAAQLASRTARHLSVAQDEIEGNARRSLDDVRDGCDLSAPLLRRLPAARRATVLREWLRERRGSTPGEDQLRVMLSLLDLREDAQGSIDWNGCSLRRYEDRLTLVTAPPAAAPAAVWHWTRASAIDLPAGRLTLHRDRRGDVDLDALPTALLVRGRPARRAHDALGAPVDVKRLLQDARVPSWLRAALPFVHAREPAVDSPLVAVADLWVSGAVRAGAAARRRARFVWQPR